MRTFTISQVAKSANVNIQTVRYYEKNNLIISPQRNKSGYRQYTDETIERIKFIKHAQELGFSLKEIAILLSLNSKDPSSCKEVKEFTEKKITEIEEKVKKLLQMKNTLNDLVKECCKTIPKVFCTVLKNFQENSKC